MVEMRWAYGITTVPSRFGDLLPRTIDSLARGGFDRPRLFVDGLRDPEDFDNRWGLELTLRCPTLRTMGNWSLGLAELYLRQPNADRYAMFQDDILVYRNLRQYLEQLAFPEKGYWNLYTFPVNLRRKPKNVEQGFFLSNQRGLGAVALVFDRSSLVALFAQRYLFDRVTDEQKGWKSIDGGIVSALKREGYREYVHAPSLVQHVGTVSSMRNRPHQQADSFRGETFDALELLK